MWIMMKCKTNIFYSERLKMEFLRFLFAKFCGQRINNGYISTIFCHFSTINIFFFFSDKILFQRYIQDNVMRNFEMINILLLNNSYKSIFYVFTLKAIKIWKKNTRQQSNLDENLRSLYMNIAKPLEKRILLKICRKIWRLIYPELFFNII